MTRDATSGESGILIIDDDESVCRSLARALRTEGLGDATLCTDPRDAEGILASRAIWVILLDLVMPHLSGEVLFERIKTRWPEIPTLIVSAMNDVDTAVRCVQAGAFDYLVKPVDFSRLLATMAKAFKQYELRAENRRLKDIIREPGPRRPECFASILTRSASMISLFRYLEAVAPSREPVLIVGETGVGKELVARALHAVSDRSGELVAVNVAGLDENAFADTLFGHVRGAFTGANSERAGMIERAGEGTLFLDEVGDVGLEMQTKLLRLLQEGEYLPLGIDRARHSRCRIVAATNRDLRKAMREGRFREVLYYRLHGHLVRVPPLRERPGDMALLVEYFMREAAETLDKPMPTSPPELPIHLSAYSFPGNVRELRTMVFDAVACHGGGVLSLNTFHRHMDESTGNAPSVERAASSPLSMPGQHDGTLPTVRQATDSLIAEALKRTKGNQGAAARMLGISRRTVNRHALRAHPVPIGNP